jgi:hypothetical protein
MSFYSLPYGIRRIENVVEAASPYRCQSRKCYEKGSSNFVPKSPDSAMRDLRNKAASVSHWKCNGVRMPIG